MQYRPWFVEAAAQEPKDIVILIDISKSMNATLDLAKAAAIVVLQTLNPNDRVSVQASIWNESNPP